MPEDDIYSKYQDKSGDIYSKYQDDGDEQMDPNATPPKKDDKSILGFLGNSVASLGGAARDTAVGTYNTVRHPFDTASSIARTALGESDKLLGNGSKDFAPEADTFNKNISDRYGSLQKTGNTLYKDPFGVASDAFAVADPVLGAAGKVSKLGKVAELANDARKFNPMRVTELPGKVAEPVLNYGADKLMKSALNTSGADIKANKIPETANYARDNRIMLNSKGASKADQLFQPTEAEINRQVDAADNQGQRVNPLRVLDPLNDKISDTLKGNAPSKYVDPLVKIKNEFLGNHSANNPGVNTVTDPHGNIYNTDTVRQTQDAKRADYQNLDYGNSITDDPMDTKGRKLLAGGSAKQVEDAITASIGQQYPSLSQLNMSEGNQLRLKKAIQEAMTRKNAGLGVADPLGATASVLASHNAPYTAIKHLAPSILSDPAFKSRLAVILDDVNKGSSQVGKYASSSNLNKARIGASGRYTIDPEAIPTQ